MPKLYIFNLLYLLHILFFNYLMTPLVYLSVKWFCLKSSPHNTKLEVVSWKEVKFCWAN